MTEEFVKNSIIKYLSRKEWGTNLQFGSLRERGVDIKVRHNRYSRYFLIECKGQGIGRSSSEVAFVYSLGQIISRMKSGDTTRYYYGLGLPEIYAKMHSVDCHGKWLKNCCFMFFPLIRMEM